VGPLFNTPALPLNVENEVQVLTCRENLRRVVSQHNLVKKWGLADVNLATDKLEGMVSGRREGSTDLATIEVLSSDMAEAAALANTVADAYQERVMAMVSEREALEINALEAEFEMQEKRVEERRVRVLVFLKNLSVPAANSDAGQVSAATELDAVKQEYESARDLAGRMSETIRLKKIAYVLPMQPMLRHEEVRPDPKVVPVDFAGSTIWGAGRGLALGLGLGALVAFGGRPRGR
jgi:hypothetical protein